MQLAKPKCAFSKGKALVKIGGRSHVLLPNYDNYVQNEGFQNVICLNLLF
jgi:hypothetical protein